jgi:nuclear GTP-binding protein
MLTLRGKPQNPQWRSRLKKDPGVPNLFPYKEQILQEVEEKRRLKEEEAQRRKQEAQSQRQQERKDDEAGQQEVRMEDASEEEPDQVESMDGNNDEEMEVCWPRGTIRRKSCPVAGCCD